MKSKFNVLLVNQANWIGISRLPKVLHDAGCKITLIAPPENFTAKSRYINELLSAPAEMPLFLDFLKSHIDNYRSKYDWFILGDDPLLYGLARRRQENWVAQCFPVDPLGRGVDFLLSKSAFPIISQQCGIPVPKTGLCKTIDEVMAAASRLGYPVILKRPSGFAGTGVGKASNPDALQKLFHKMGKMPFVVVQEFIQGEVYGAPILYNHGKLLCHMTFRKIKTHPGPFGPTSAMKFEHLPELTPVLARLGELFNFHGLSGVDFIRNPSTGDIKIMEQHSRPTSQIYLAKKAGVDFSEAIKIMLSGKDNNRSFCQNPEFDAYIPMFPQDLFRSIREKDYKGLKHDILSLNWWQDLMWSEPTLFAMHLKSAYKQFNASNKK